MNWLGGDQWVTSGDSHQSAMKISSLASSMKSAACDMYVRASTYLKRAIKDHKKVFSFLRGYVGILKESPGMSASWHRKTMKHNRNISRKIAKVSPLAKALISHGIRRAEPMRIQPDRLQSQTSSPESTVSRESKQIYRTPA